MEIELIRDDEPSQKHNYGKLFVNGKYLGETLEDTDRYLETGEQEKVHGDTAIPRGRYRVDLTPSTRWKGKLMLLICDVPGFDGVRIHGGNTEADTQGCPLLGNVRTADGIANCAGVNERLINLVSVALANKEEVWLNVQ